MKVSIFKTINWIKVEKIKRTDDRYKWSKRRWPFNNSLYEILGGNFYLNFFIQLNWVLDASVIEPEVEINTGPGIIGLCYPTEKQFLMKKLIGITSHLLCNSFIIIPKFTKNKILYIYYIQFHCQNIMHQTSS